jgi:hypothetical protein
MKIVVFLAVLTPIVALGQFKSQQQLEKLFSRLRLGKPAALKSAYRRSASPRVVTYCSLLNYGPLLNDVEHVFLVTQLTVFATTSWATTVFSAWQFKMLYDKIPEKNFLVRSAVIIVGFMPTFYLFKVTIKLLMVTLITIGNILGPFEKIF